MRYCLGVDVGGTSVKLGLFETEGKLLDKWEIPTRKENHGEQILPDVAASILEKLEERKIRREDVAGVGMGIPAPVDSEGVVQQTANVGWGYKEVTRELSELLDGMRVEAGNDANVAAMGEMWLGAGRGEKNVVMVTLGTGVGAGIVIDGKIYAGSNFAGAEIGHTVIEVGGAPCTCGRKGCFEAYSSATGLIRMTKESMAENPDSIMNKMAEERGKVTARTSFDCMRAGDKYAKAVVDKYIKYLAAGITNTINTFQPDILCIGGGVCNEGDPLLLPVKAIVEEEDFANKSEKRTEIVIAKLGNDAGLIGAAFLGRANS